MSHSCLIAPSRKEVEWASNVGTQLSAPLSLEEIQGGRDVLTVF